MALQNETRRAWGAAGLGNSSCLDGIDGSELSPPTPPFQANFHVARRRRLVTHLHRLGPAPLAHFISDIERGGGIDTTLERYCRLPAEFVLAYGGDKFPATMFAIRGGQR